MEVRVDLLQSISYCILHGWQGLPERLSSDLDIVVVPKDLLNLEEALLETNGARLVNLLQHESTCYYFVLAVREGEDVRFLPIDAATDYRRDGRVWFTAGELLKGRRRWKGFWVSAPEVESKYLLVKKILKGSVPEPSAKRLRELVEELGDQARELAIELLGKPLGERVIDWIEAEAWETFQSHIPALQKTLKRQRLRQDPFNALRYWLPEIRRVWQRWRYPTGLFVAVLGPDGSGKSTLIAHLERELKGAFRRTAVLHLMPGLLRRGANGGPVAAPHGKPPRSLPTSLLKLLYYLLDYNLGYWLKIRPALVRSTLVLFDRYYDDLLVDPKRYRYGGPLWLARWLRRLIPRPDLWLILDVPATEILHRKQEMSIEELRRQRGAYRRLTGELSNAFLIDGSLPPEEVARQAREIVLDYLHERYLSRRPLWFLTERKDGLDWLETALRARKVSDGKPFLHLALPDGRGYLLPVNSRRAAVRALSLYTPQKPKSRLAKGLLRLGVKTGIARHLLPEVRLDFDKLRGMLEEVFGRQDLSLAVSLGMPGPHRKPVVQVLTERGEVLGYVKVGWNQQTKELVLNELRSIEYISSLRLPRLRVPEILYFGCFEDLYILVTAPATGTPLGSLQETGLVLEALEVLAKNTAKETLFLESVFWSDLLSRVAQLDGYVPVYQQRILARALSVMDVCLRSCTLPWVFRFGDIAPWNVFVEEGGSLQVIDLEYAKLDWLPGWDVYHFLRASGERYKSLGCVWQDPILLRYFEALRLDKAVAEALYLAYLVDLFTEWKMAWKSAGLPLSLAARRVFQEMSEEIRSVTIQLEEKNGQNCLS